MLGTKSIALIRFFRFSFEDGSEEVGFHSIRDLAHGERHPDVLRASITTRVRKSRLDAQNLPFDVAIRLVVISLPIAEADGELCLKIGNSATS